MSIVEEKSTRDGTCPCCGAMYSLEDWGRNKSGELADGLLWTRCYNCQEQLEMVLKLTHRQKVEQ